MAHPLRRLQCSRRLGRRLQLWAAPLGRSPNGENCHLVVLPIHFGVDVMMSPGKQQPADANALPIGEGAADVRRFGQ